MATFDHTRKQGDTSDPLDITLTDSLGDYPIPASADVFLTMRRVFETEPTIDRAAMVPHADQEAFPGRALYHWETPDVATPGSYFFEIEVVPADGKPIRFPRDSAAPFGILTILRNITGTV
jgi:hypothetical protein